MQKARRHPRRGSDRLWAHGFRYYFTPLRGVLFTFPSRYWFAIGLLGVFSLAGWSRRVRAGFLGSRPTQGRHLARPAASPTGLSPSPGRRSRRLGSRRPRDSVGPTTPRGPQPAGFGLLPFRSPLLGESLLSSPPPATGMFRFTGFASPLRGDGQPSAGRVAPFGRRLSRPSSPPGARASTVRPASLPARSRRWASRPGAPARRPAPPRGRGPLLLSLLTPAHYHVKERYRGECRSRTDDPLLAKQVL